MGMYGNFKGSFTSQFRRQGKSLKCELCGDGSNPNSTLDTTSEYTIETPQHYLELCPLVSDLRSQYDTETDLGLVGFFRSVMQRRSEQTGSQASYDTDYN